MQNKSHIPPVHWAALENGLNPDIGTLKKESREIFPEDCTKFIKEKVLHYVNKVLFELAKIALKDTYLVETTLTALQNEVFTCPQMYYNK